MENGIVDMYSDLGMKYHPKMKNHKNIIPCFDEEDNLRFLVARNDKQNLMEGDKKTWNIKGIPTYFLNQFYLEGHRLSKEYIILITESWGDSLAAQTVISNNELKVVALHSTSNVKRLGELLTRNRDKLDNAKFIIAFNNDKENAEGHSPGKLATNKTVKILDALNFEYEVFMPEKYNDLNEWLLNNKEEFTLRNGKIRDVKKEDMIIDTIPYNLVNKDLAVEFMESRILNIYKYVLGEERLNFLLDFLAMKLSGRNYQLALINIGPSKSGKSMMKNLTTNLYPDLVSQIPYTYLTTSHRGNMGAERDDVIVNLDKKLIALSSEVEKNDAPIAIGRFKNVLSNSITDARATGGKMQKGIDLTHLDMIIDTNEMPSFSGYDDAIEKRQIIYIVVKISWKI